MQGYAKAQNRLSLRYSRGEGVAQDDVRALYWALLAAGRGHVAAASNVAALKSRMSETEVAEAEELAGRFQPTEEGGS